MEKLLSVQEISDCLGVSQNILRLWNEHGNFTNGFKKPFVISTNYAILKVVKMVEVFFGN